MRAVEVLICCLLVFPLVGTVSNPWPKSRTKFRVESEETKSLRGSLEALAAQARDLFRTGQYPQAIQKFDIVRTQAEAAHLTDLAVRAIGNTGACEFALHRYQDALRTLLRAHGLAESIGDTSLATLFDANIASLYSDLGELDAAAQWTQGILMRLKRLSPKDQRQSEPQLLLQMATLRARQHRMAEAEALFGLGLDAADRAGDLELYATGWNRLGEEHLRQHNLRAAEAALLEAYRIRKLNHLPLDSSYRSLGRLRLEQGDLASASELLDRAVELSARPRGPLPAWNVYYARGRVALAQGRLHKAVEDLRIAVRLARDWRWIAPAGDAARIGMEGGLEDVYSALIEAGNRLYLETGDAALIRETFEAAEENRAASLRALVAVRQETEAAQLPPAYWEALGRLQRAEVQSLRTAGTQAEAANAQVAGIRAELARMELTLGPAAAPLPAALLDRARATLDGDAALLSFHLGASDSWMWALDREGLVLHRLPGREAIEFQVQAAANALRTDAASADLAAAQLYGILFGTLEPRFQQKTRWLLALDRGLFETPFAALRTGDAYLAETHTLELIPGAGFWIEAAARPRTPISPVFVGLGDAIYNTADPRLTRQPGAKSPLLLPRLVASGHEVEDCARAWGAGSGRGEHVLLEGEAASRANLLRQLARNPAVVHLATHVLRSPDPSAQGLIALSLTPRHENELLPPQEIAGWHTAAGVVVMSGCHSAEGRVLPGTGLLGLTRAWLVAGARSVIASNWATPDENGGLFSALYRRLGTDQSAGPAAALRAAQVEMIRAGGWRARPRYWGAYFVVGAG